MHLGHLAGQNITCDVFARYHRLKGNKVLMVSGSDCHGAAIAFNAESAGKKPAEFADEAHKSIVETMQKLNLVYENYTSTRTENHKVVVHNLFGVLIETGYLVKHSSKQYFDTKISKFLPDRYVRGTCPDCGNPEARGDECPECGRYLEPEQLMDPYSTLSDSKPELRETEHYYLDLSKLQDKLSQYVEKAAPNWRKWVAEFSKGWLKSGLNPRPITRDMDYGIPIPLEGWDQKVIYVWFEAVIGYLSAAIEWAEKQGDPSAWENFWKSPETKHYYFIAGGNVPFHTIIWPGELLGYNEKYNNPALVEKYALPGETNNRPLNLPYDVPANKMLLFKGKKMSKGDNYGFTVADLIANYNADLIRYFFIKYAPENHDREFIWKDLIDANNNELVGNLGNFINRALTFAVNKFDGVVPDGDLDPTVHTAIEQAFTSVGGYLEKAEFVKATESLLELGAFANKYFNDQEPWATIKISTDTAGQTIFNSIQLVSALSSLMRPFTPTTSDKINAFIGIESIDPTKEVAETGITNSVNNYWSLVPVAVGTKLATPSILFEKLEYTDKLLEIDSSSNESSTKAQALTFTKDEKLNSIPTDWTVLTDLKITNKPSKRQIQFIKDLVQKTRDLYESNPDWRKDVKFAGYRALHQKYSESEFLPSSEKLVEFILDKGELPNINSFVDVYNSVSAYTGISIGAHDISKIVGEPKLELLTEDKEYLTITEGEKSTAKSGEYCYTDDRGVLCRLDIKQSARTKVGPKTSNILVIFQGHDQIDEKALKQAKELLMMGVE